MIDFKEIPTGEIWELFARDFLQERGFYIESMPDRGADAGRHGRRAAAGGGRGRRTAHGGRRAAAGDRACSATPGGS